MVGLFTVEDYNRLSGPELSPPAPAVPRPDGEESSRVVSLVHVDTERVDGVLELDVYEVCRPPSGLTGGWSGQAGPEHLPAGTVSPPGTVVPHYEGLREVSV